MDSWLNFLKGYEYFVDTGFCLKLKIIVFFIFIIAI